MPDFVSCFSRQQGGAGTARRQVTRGPIQLTFENLTKILTKNIKKILTTTVQNRPFSSTLKTILIQLDKNHLENPHEPEIWFDRFYHMHELVMMS